MKTKKLWFKAKWFGWGWRPVSWEGWAVTALYLFIIITKFQEIDAKSHSGSDTLIGFALPFILYTVGLLIICYLTGEKPHWSWGWKK